MPSLDDLRALGYDIAVAYGDVAREQEALAEAERVAGPEQLELDVAGLVQRAVTDAATLQTAGQLPADMEGFAQRIFTQVTRELTQARNQQVEFHRRAVAAAQAMPTVYTVAGYGIRLHVAVDDATGDGVDDTNRAVLASLADPDAHRERRWQHLGPQDAVEKTLELRDLGSDVAAEIVDEKIPTWQATVDGVTATTVAKLDELLAAKRP